MAKKRVYEISHELNLSSKELVKILNKIGIPVSNHMSNLEPNDIERVYQYLAPPEEKKIIEKRIKPSVIRRRVKRLKPEAETVEPPIEEPVEKIETTPEPIIEKPSIEPPSLQPPAEEKTAPQVTIPPVNQKEEKEKAVPEKEAKGKRIRLKDLKTKTKGPIARIIKMPEPVPEKEQSVSSKETKARPKKRRVLISEEKPAPAKNFRKERKKGNREITPPAKTFRERSRKPYKVKRPELIKTQETKITAAKPVKRKIKISEFITVAEIAKKMGVKVGEVIKKLLELGVMATINQAIDVDTAQLISEEFGHEVEKISLEAEEILARQEDEQETLVPRPPVITVMGHVDHGKTKLLDAIRQTNVTAEEAGGITQHIGAYHVILDQGEIVFIDTPGHEAFTAMRARGSQATDIVVLVVAADDGVKEQTREAINHARDAKVPIIVAINKIDVPEADIERVTRELSENGLVPEDWGGDTIFVEISAKQKVNINKLLEMILLQAEVLELKANPDKLARGIIIESRLDKGQGPVATVLIQEGTLRVGDPFVSGHIFGKVRAMFDDRAKKIKKAGPSIPVGVVGFSGIPNAGDSFIVVREERKARLAG